MTSRQKQLSKIIKSIRKNYQSLDKLIESNKNHTDAAIRLGDRMKKASGYLKAGVTYVVDSWYDERKY